ncbi:unnamed protein product [Lactuca saligna]|uniref:Uncharacterized protein n=1 Tax=Lactuca saligna TaxID=75948 RepID=A0AA35ZX36_LACSI|nr:unnamed protein product [Lactuca saligna]
MCKATITDGNIQGNNLTRLNPTKPTLVSFFSRPLPQRHVEGEGIRRGTCFTALEFFLPIVNLEFIAMASSIVNMPLNVGTIRGLDCRTYGNLKNTLPIQPSASTLPHRRMLVLKASINDGPMKKMGRSDAECEAAVVAGNIPEAPPVPATPSSPAGTPVVPSLLSTYHIMSQKPQVLLAAI